jgi:HK97 family phage portal protein
MVDALKDLPRGTVVDSRGIPFPEIGPSMKKKDHLGMLATLGSNHVMRPPKRGTLDILKAFATHPTLHAATEKIANGIGSVEWTVSMRVTNGTKGNAELFRNTREFLKSKMKAVPAGRDILHGKRETRSTTRKRLVATGELAQLEDHPVLDVISNGNQFHTGMGVLKVSNVSLDLIGEAFLLKDRSTATGKPTGLFPIPAWWVRDIPVTSDGVFKLSYLNFSQDVPAGDMIYMRNLDVVDPYGRGIGTGWALKDELATDEFASLFTKSFFYNDARPSIIVSSEGLDPDDTERLERMWLERFQGFHKYHLPFFMGTDIKVDNVGTNFKDMDLIPLRSFERDTIIQTFGVSPEILGITISSNRASIQVAEFLFTKYVLVPRLEQIRSYLQRFLVTEFDDRLILDYITPVAENDEHNLNVMKEAPWAFIQDEIRAMGGHDALPEGKGGDNFKVSIGDHFQETLTESEDLIDAQPLANETEEEINAGNKGSNSDPDNSSQSKPVGVVDRAFEDQDINAVLAAITTGVLHEKLDPIIALTVDQFGQNLVDDIGIGGSFDILNPAVIDFIENDSAVFITGINQTTRKRVRKALKKGLKEGESLNQLADRVAAVFDSSRGARSKMIARTETVRAANFGTQNSMKQNGVEKRSWLTTRDGDVRDEHKELDGVVADIDEPFEVAGESAMFPGDFGVAELDINCRCLLKPVIDGKKFNADTGERGSIAAWKSFESDRLPLETKYRKSLRQAFNDQEREALKALRAAAKSMAIAA